MHAHFPYIRSDKHYDSMHCQWHYSHWKIIKINQKRKIKFCSLLVERGREEEGKENNHSELLLRIELIGSSTFKEQSI